MMLKRYQNEIIVIVAFLFLLLAYGYKNSSSHKLAEAILESNNAAMQADDIISLKKQWDNPNTKKEVATLENEVSKDKVKLFTLKGKKLNATYINLTGKEMNQIVTKLENLAVVIEELKVNGDGTHYKMEIKCKW